MQRQQIITIVIPYMFVINSNTVGSDTANVYLSLHEWVRGGGSRPAVIFTDLAFDV